MWILGLKGLWKRLFRALEKVSLLLKINLLIKLVLWSFFGPNKGWEITRAPLLDLSLVSPSLGLWHQETEAVRVTGTHVVLTGRISQPLSRASLLTTVFDP